MKYIILLSTTHRSQVEVIDFTLSMDCLSLTNLSSLHLTKNHSNKNTEKFLIGTEKEHFEMKN